MTNTRIIMNVTIPMRQEQELVRRIQSYENLEVRGEGTVINKLLHRIMKHYDEHGICCVYSDMDVALVPTTPSHLRLHTRAGIRSMPAIPLDPRQSVALAIHRMVIADTESVYVDTTTDHNDDDDYDDDRGFPQSMMATPSCTFLQLLKRISILLLTDHTNETTYGGFSSGVVPFQTSTLQRLDALLRIIRGHDRPFGGLQVIYFHHQNPEEKTQDHGIEISMITV